MGVTDPKGAVTRYRYDIAGNRVRTDSPDAGTQTDRYDAAGNLVEHTDALGQTTRYHYDALDRPLRIEYADGQTVTYRYDSAPHGIGRLVRITDPAGTTERRYDRLGRLRRERHTDPQGHRRVVRYRYTRDGRLRRIVYPSGRVLDYRYRHGRLHALRLDGRPLIRAIRYTPAGRLAGWTWADGTRYTRQYDAAGRLQRLDHPDGPLQLRYDRSGNLVEERQAAHRRHYRYDAASRLTGAQAPEYDLSYRYDPNGNRLQARDGGQEHSYGYAPDSNRLTERDGQAVQSDAAGHLVDDGAHRYRYDARGRLVGVDGQDRYQYNALGQRASRRIDRPYILTADLDGDGRIGRHDRHLLHEAIEARHYLYRGAALLGEYDTGGRPLQEIVWLNDLPVILIEGRRLYRIYTDHLGTPRALTDRHGRLVWRWNPRPFGDSPAEEDPDGDGRRLVFELRFPGQYRDAETGLYYNYFRYYDPATGRYITSDPIGLSGGSNLYVYVRGNPISWVDWLGLIWVTVDVDYHGWKNWFMGISNRLSNLEEGTIASPRNCVGCTRDVIQEWIPHPDDPKNNRDYCRPDDPIPGDRRKIEQQFGEFPDPWNVNGKSWHWEPPVPSPTYQNSFEGSYY